MGELLPPLNCIMSDMSIVTKLLGIAHQQHTVPGVTFNLCAKHGVLLDLPFAECAVFIFAVLRKQPGLSGTASQAIGGGSVGDVFSEGECAAGHGPVFPWAASR